MAEADLINEIKKEKYLKQKEIAERFRKPNIHIVDIYGLAEILLTSPNTLRKKWHRLPHFYVGMGHNLKSARFDVGDVIDFLKKEAQNGTIQTQATSKRVVRSIYDRQTNTQKRGISNKVRSIGMGRKRKIQDKAPGRIGAQDDPFNLCTGIK